MTEAAASAPLRVALLLACLHGLGAPVVRGEASADLGGTSWRLVKFQGADGATLTPDDPAKYAVELGTDGQVSVRIDCNRGRATWRSGGPNQLALGPLALTRAACPPAILSDRLVRDWILVRTYTLKEGHLLLSLARDEGRYELEPVKAEGTGAGAPAASGEPLEGTHWTLTFLGDAAVVQLFGQTESYLVLDPASRRVEGSGGCNRLMGAYELEGDHLSFAPMAGTMMACPGMGTEKAFLESLGRAKAWKVAGQRLDLLDAAGMVVARFEARLVQ